MKKILSLVVILAGFSLFTQTLFAQIPILPAQTSVAYYDAYGLRVYGNDLYQMDEGWLYFGRNCYYFDQYGNKVSANGRRAFYYDMYGNFIAGRQVYQYPQGYYYGNPVSGSAPVYYYYYDIYGNLVATSPYDYRYGAYGNYTYDYYRYSSGE
jgi:hypothetical protein